MSRIPILVLLCSLFSFPSSLAIAQSAISKKIEGMTPMPGFLPLYWDAKNGKVWLEIDRWNTELLYVISLPTGLGSNDVGLDRGQLGGTKIVRFERSGPKVLLIQSNYSFRATSDNPDERRAVQQAFAESVIWGFQIEAEDGTRALVDATSFYLRDAHNAIERLRDAKQGAYRLDLSRSAFYLPRTKNFPKNTEVEVTLTFAGDAPGPFVSEVTPSPDAITLREHQSFIQLPDAGYQPLPLDPRAGFFGIAFMDYATPVGDPITKRFAERHRLQKKDPSAAISDPVKPIVYYLDRGAPEPIRSALLEGARWWGQAFEAAGYRNAFRVELMPEGADPMDIRYNVIQWVHRYTRGWSYGATVSDPRTGEILKGHVTLGSLRVRQDYLIAEGLLAPYTDGAAVPPDMLKMSLARLRQLAAHEVGHTLGLAHNFAASTSARASVMDYPHPLIQLQTPGAPDLSDAYATGIGEWDKVAIRWGYQDQSASSREQLLKQAYTSGLYFISDPDSRPLSSAHPYSHLWDNGKNAVDELNRMMQIRARALSRFSEKNIREGAPMSTLEDTLVPVYLLHRYQTQAAAKSLGGLDYRYALRGDGQIVANVVSGAEQRRALNALLATIDPAALTIPENILKLIPPPAFEYRRSREDFHGHTGVTFDPLGAAESAANLTIGLMLDPDRASRVVQYHARDASVPGLGEIVDALINATWKRSVAGGLQTEVHRAVDQVLIYHLMALAMSDSAAPQARAIASSKLGDLASWLKSKAPANADEKAHYAYGVSQIGKFQENPKQLSIPKPVDPPPGEPIGMDFGSL